MMVRTSALVAALALLLAALAVGAPRSALADEPADDPTVELSAELKDHVVTRARFNGVALGVLGGWSIGSMVGGGVGMATTPRDGAMWSFHQMNLVWGGIDLAIAGAAGIWIAVQTRHPGDAVSVLRGGNRLQVLYALNLGLDVAYMSSGFLLEQVGNLQGNPTLQGYGPAIALQGGVLLALDAILVVANALHDDQLLNRRRDDWAAARPSRRWARFENPHTLVF